MLLFHNLNSFTYNLFNKFYKLFICNKNKVDGLELFLKKGYQKLNKIDSIKINYIRTHLTNSNIQQTKVAEGQTRYNINDEIYKIVEKIFQEDLKDITSELEKYYNARIILSGVSISRNHNVSTNKETFSNYLHNDGYLFTCNQIFVNLMDVNHENGPLHFLDFDLQKKFVKNIPLFSTLRRYFYKDYFDFDDVNHNVGKIGDALLVNTSEIVHAAGTPSKDKIRDILFLEISAIPKSHEYQKKMNINNNLFNDENNILTKNIAKPKNVKTLFKWFIYYFLSLKTNK